MKKYRWLIVAGAIVIVVIIVVIIWLGSQTTGVATFGNPEDLPGISQEEAPWPSETTELEERLDIIGLPTLTNEDLTLHTHEHLTIFVRGRQVRVPPDIGIAKDESFTAPIHTHEPDGVIHVESPIRQEFTLGQFFDIWGVLFTDECLGGYCTDEENNLRVFVNGEEITFNPRLIVLMPYQEIVVAYGTDDELPEPIPRSYTFPPGF